MTFIIIIPQLPSVLSTLQPPLPAGPAGWSPRHCSQATQSSSSPPQPPACLEGRVKGSDHSGTGSSSPATGAWLAPKSPTRLSNTTQDYALAWTGVRQGTAREGNPPTLAGLCTIGAKTTEGSSGESTEHPRVLPPTQAPCPCTGDFAQAKPENKANTIKSRTEQLGRKGARHLHLRVGGNADLLFPPPPVPVSSTHRSQPPVAHSWYFYSVQQIILDSASNYLLLCASKSHRLLKHLLGKQGSFPGNTVRNRYTPAGTCQPGKHLAASAACPMEQGLPEEPAGMSDGQISARVNATGDLVSQQNNCS